MQLHRPRHNLRQCVGVPAPLNIDCEGTGGEVSHSSLKLSYDHGCMNVASSDSCWIRTRRYETNCNAPRSCTEVIDIGVQTDESLTFTTPTRMQTDTVRLDTKKPPGLDKGTLGFFRFLILEGRFLTLEVRFSTLDVSKKMRPEMSCRMH